jgi:diacylglycerol kinase family enzyme
MKIAPDASLNDGRLDIVAVGDMSTLEILANAPRLYFGKHLGLERVRHALAVRLTARPLKRDEEIKLEIDGELPGRLPATFEIVESAINIRCPAR